MKKYQVQCNGFNKNSDVNIKSSSSIYNGCDLSIKSSSEYKEKHESSYDIVDISNKSSGDLI